jgi:4-amino-4-deoxy-L-arabinose transferase-like glycosyltransferase
MRFSGIFSWRPLVAHPFGVVFLLALSMRLLNLVLLRGNGSFFAEPDTLSYWALGAALAKPDTFWSTFLAMTDRMPLYPLLLAAIESTLGDNPRAVALIQAVIDAGTCTLIAALGALISPMVGLIAGVLAAVSFTLIVFSSQILTDTLFLFFFTLMLLAGARFLIRPSNGLALLAGLAGGLSIAVRPAAVILLAAGVPVVFVGARVQHRRVAAALAAALLFAIAAAAPIAPVLLRNMIHYRTLSLTSQTGDHFAFWIVPLVVQRANGTPYRESVERMLALYQRRLSEHDRGFAADPFRRAALLAQVAREEMAQVPRLAIVEAWLDGMLVNLGAPALLDDPRVRALPKPSYYDTPGVSLWQRTRTYLFGEAGPFHVLLAAGLAGMLLFLALESIGFVMLAQKLPWAAALAGGVLAYFILLNGPVIGPKYRLPMEPILIVLAAIPLAWLAERSKARSAMMKGAKDQAPIAPPSERRERHVIHPLKCASARPQRVKT